MIDRLKRSVSLFAASFLVALALPAGLLAREATQHRPVSDTRITILQTTDVHHSANGVGHVGFDVDPLTGLSSKGGYSRIAAYANHVRATAGNPVVLLDSGDWTMGTLYDLTLAQQPVGLYFLDLLEYNCTTLGNHEFDYTSAGLAQMLFAAQQAFGLKTPIVATNMNLNGDENLSPFVGEGRPVQATRVETLPNGLKVGYFGLMGRSAALDSPAAAPVTFTDPATEYDSIQALVDDMRNSRGVQIVIALSHSGTNAAGTEGEDVELARHVTGIDVIASGHTHTPLASAKTIKNGSWSTRIINAGAYGTSVARIDLAYDAATKSTTLSSSSNVAMTDASLNEIQKGLGPDPLVSGFVRFVDQMLNAGLAPLFEQVFADYDPVDLSTGVYHPVALSAQDMISNEYNAVLCPNGLGNLATDSVRNVANSVIADVLKGVGGDPSKAPGYDFNPVQMSVVATGLLRGSLPAGVPLTFADIYNILPLGISPDLSQEIPVGYPVISAYMVLEDVKKVCALQLVAQTNLVSSDYYLNFSGLRYSLKPTDTYWFFKYASAASVLVVTAEKAALGSVPALQALGALSTVQADGGAAVFAAFLAGNPYATAMVKLNDGALYIGHAFENVAVMGHVALTASQDAAAGTTRLEALIVSKAIAAIDTVWGFAATDTMNTGSTSLLSGSARVRMTADLYALLLLDAVESQFGTKLTIYKSATGGTTLSSADMAGLMENRVNMAPLSGAIVEMKEWMALLSYVGTGLKGSIPPDYASTTNFAQFPTFGAAVKMRNPSYPLADIAQLATTLMTLQAAP